MATEEFQYYTLVCRIVARKGKEGKSLYALISKASARQHNIEQGDELALRVMEHHKGE